MGLPLRVEHATRSGIEKLFEAYLLVEQTNAVAGIRFAFFFVKAICMIAMGVLIAISAQSWSA
jgi:hypothetical protein